MENPEIHVKPYSFSRQQRVYLVFKRLIDIVLSLVLIVLCFVFLWWWVTIINLFASKGHPFFGPKRYGKNQKVFTMFKFRSMKVDAPFIPPYEMSEEQRDAYETGFGKFLRLTSIDETPQFINVLIGNMSLCGPRPGGVEYEENLVKARLDYNPNAFMVKPGLTGYSQVYMKRQHDVDSKAWFDSEYVKKMSFILDLKILAHTALFMKGR